ncbi:MAG: ribonucleoside-diphosphate reductase [Gammaproteobacteria bacterium]|nr:ribonucleoside-diphosphate reductase [Gammaproteobacteria bacterium]
MDRPRDTPIISLPPLQDASAFIAASKYFLPGEDLDGMRRRLALALARPEANPSRWEEPFYRALHYAFPGGRIMANAGAEALKPNVSTINCTVSRTIEDSMRGIMEALAEAALTLKAGCGIGYDFSTLRPRGAWVQGAGAITSGPLPFMDVFDAACKTISSAGGRRGAQMGCLEVSHPDVETFIVAKREAGRLRAFNLSCLISDEFVQAVKNDAPWPLVFPVFPGELEGTEIVWRRWPLADSRYTVNERGEIACKVYRTVRARELWALVMHGTYDYSDPGFILIDEINRMNPLWFCEEIRATNPCVTGNAWVQTAEGARQVRELLGRPLTLQVDGRSVVTTAQGFFQTGVRPVVRLSTREGHALRLTADHRVLRVRRLTRWTRETEWTEAGSLKPGDLVVLHDHCIACEWAGTGGYEEGYLLGLLIGDGTLKRDEAALSVWMPRAVVGAHTATGAEGVMAEALRCTQRLPRRADFRGWRPIAGRNEYRLSLAALTRLAHEYGLAPANMTVTPEIERDSSAFYRGFLRGLFDTDGSVQGTQAKGVSVRLAQSDLPLLQAVQRMLLRLGVASTIDPERRAAGLRGLPDGRGGRVSYPVRSQHEVVITGSNLIVFRECIGFADRDKAARLDSALANYRRTLNAERFVATVESVSPDGEEMVYDVQIPGAHAFDANGLYVHNCGEQPLPQHGACLLGSVNLASLVRRPFSAEAAFDFETFREVVRTFSRMLDNVVEINALPLPQQQTEILRKRRHGMGYFGLGSALTMLGLRYGAPVSVAFTEEVTKMLALESWRAALELAREKGPAPILTEDFEITPALLALRPELAADGVKAGAKLPGRVLHARYSRYMQRIASLDAELTRALADVGARYTHATSIAPTGTMAAAVGNNASNGIEPSFAHAYTRNMIVPGEKAKRAVRMESFELLVYRRAVDAGVDPEKLPPTFNGTATGTDPRGHIDVQAAAQRWIDSSISKTINVPTDIGFEDFQNLYLYAIDQGLKGCTTFRFNPEAHQGVLVSDRDLADTIYEFRLADGRSVQLAGNAMVEYEGQRYTAANLYDAFKEGFYGRL